MSKETPLVSVVMPAYNSEKYISEAIESILNQTFKDFEFIIVDDCSTDKTWKIIQDYAKKDSRIIAIRNEKNLKISATLNKGISIARGKYIARMDSDDWSYPDRFKRQVEFLGNNPDVTVVGGFIEICNSKLEFINVRKYNLDDKNIRKKIFRYNPFAHPTVMIRKDMLQKAGLYNVSLEHTQDYELYFRLGKIGQFANLSTVLLKLRTHSKSSSLSKGKKQEYIALYSRIKAHMEYGYEMGFMDKIYTFLQWLSTFIIPSRLKFWIFNLFRSPSKIKD